MKRKIIENFTGIMSLLILVIMNVITINNNDILKGKIINQSEYINVLENAIDFRDSMLDIRANQIQQYHELLNECQIDLQKILKW